MPYPTNPQPPAYPSQSEILAVRPDCIDRYLPIVKAWKWKHWKGWKDKPNSEKMEALMDLVVILATTADLPDQAIPAVIPDAGIYAYNFQDNEIMLDHNHASVVSTLHEFGHYLMGDSELEACRFSVWLFAEAFPGSYAKLHFDGHMLKT